MSCACDYDYDSDSGAMREYICDWCRCDYTPYCYKHSADFNRVKSFYYEMLEIGGHLLTGIETPESDLYRQHDVLRRICIFVQKTPDFFIAHAEVLHAIMDSLYDLLEKPAAAPLYDLFRETLAFATRLDAP